MLSIKVKLTIALLLMSLVPLSTMGMINYVKTTEVFANSIQRFLLDIARSRESILENYINTTESSAKALSDTDIFQKYISFPNVNSLSPSELEEYRKLESLVENLLYSFQKTHWGQYHHIFLINKSRQISVSPNHGDELKGSPSSHLMEDTSKNKWVSKAFEEGVTTVSDFSSWVESDHNHQMLFFPVKDATGVTRAVIGFELQIPYEQELLSKDLKLGETGRIFLTTADGDPIVYEVTESKVMLDVTGVSEAKSDGFYTAVRENSAGVEVINLYLKHKKYPWILVAEIEVDEAYRDLKLIQTSMAILSLVTLLLAILFAILLSNLIVKPINHLTSQIEEVSMGDLDIKIDGMERKDEIGKLVRSFNRTITSLKMMMKNYKSS